MKDKSLIVIITYNSADFIEDCLASIAEQDYREWQLVIVDNDSSDDTVKRIRHLWNQTTTFSAENFRLITLKKNIGFARAVNHAVFSSIRIASGNKDKKNSINRGSRPQRAILSGKDQKRISGYRTYTDKRGSGPVGDLFDHLILLNPDIYLLPGALKNLTGTFNRGGGGQIGACGGLILDYKKDIVQHLAGRMTRNFITYHDGAGISLSDLDREQDDDSIPGHPGSGGTNREKLVDADYVTGAFFATRFSLFKA
ncbi:MAG: glycosyltransferase, partial [Actinobacteria bacterium]|nr:glycosyltransferase [Actinomycetota bacterium]